MTWPLFKPPEDNTSWTWREHVFTDTELDRIVAQGEEQGMMDATVGPGAVDGSPCGPLGPVAPGPP